MPVAWEMYGGAGVGSAGGLAIRRKLSGHWQKYASHEQGSIGLLRCQPGITWKYAHTRGEWKHGSMGLVRCGLAGVRAFVQDDML